MHRFEWTKFSKPLMHKQTVNICVKQNLNKNEFLKSLFRNSRFQRQKELNRIYFEIILIIIFPEQKKLIVNSLK